MHERFVVFKQAAMLMKQENFFRRILKKSLVPSGRKQLFSCQSTWPPWRELKVQGFIWRDLTPNFNYLYLTDTLLNKYPDLLFVLKHKQIPFQPQNGDRIEAFDSGKWVPRPASFLVALGDFGGDVTCQAFRGAVWVLLASCLSLAKIFFT